jgi:predicted MFS family arabinose efflux permease
LGEAFRPANAAAIANHTNDDNRIRSYALNRLAVNLGWGIGPAVGGLLADYSTALLFWADGLTCIAASLLLWFLLTPSTIQSVRSPKREKIKTASAYRDKPFMRGMFYLFLITLAFFQLFSVVPAYFRTEVLLSKTVIGAILAMNGLLIAMFEMILVYKLENKRTSFVYIMIGAFLVGLSFLCFEVGKSLPVVIAAMIIVTFGEMFLFPFLNHFWVKRSSATNRGEYAAVYTMAFASASVLAPTMGTQLAADGGFTLLWVVDFVLCGLAALGFYFLKKELS